MKRLFICRLLHPGADLPNQAPGRSIPGRPAPGLGGGASRAGRRGVTVLLRSLFPTAAGPAGRWKPDSSAIPLRLAICPGRRHCSGRAPVGPELSGASEGLYRKCQCREHHLWLRRGRLLRHLPSPAHGLPHHPGQRLRRVPSGNGQPLPASHGRIFSASTGTIVWRQTAWTPWEPIRNPFSAPPAPRLRSWPKLFKISSSKRNGFSRSVLTSGLRDSGSVHTLTEIPSSLSAPPPDGSGAPGQRFRRSRCS